MFTEAKDDPPHRTNSWSAHTGAPSAFPGAGGMTRHVPGRAGGLEVVVVGATVVVGAGTVEVGPVELVELGSAVRVVDVEVAGDELA